MRKEWKHIKNKTTQIVIIIFLIILSVSLYILIKDFLEYKRSNDYTSELIEKVITNENKIDWEELEKINKDIVGWIRIDDTNINYPILKDDFSLKYLKHLYNGDYNENGSIFTLDNNPFEKNITILYGHNMTNNIMFSELSNYMDESFFNAHSSFDIYTKNKNYKVKIFSCYSIDVNIEENNIKSLNFNKELEYYKKSSKFSVDDTGKIDKIIKLSTCSYTNSHTIPTDQRYYIIGKLEEAD